MQIHIIPRLIRSRVTEDKAQSNWGLCVCRPGARPRGGQLKIANFNGFEWKYMRCLHRSAVASHEAKAMCLSDGRLPSGCIRQAAYNAISTVSG